MNILFLSDFIPNPEIGNAGSKTMAFYIKGMYERGHAISVLSTGSKQEASQPNSLQEYCRNFRLLPRGTSFMSRYKRGLQSIKIPPEYELCDTSIFENNLRDILNHSRFDIIHALHPWLIHAVHNVQFRYHPTPMPALVGHVMDVVSKVFYDKMLGQRGLKFYYWALRYARMSSLEFSDYDSSDALLVHSTLDRDIIRSLAIKAPPIIFSPIWFDSIDTIIDEISSTHTHNILYVGNSDDPRMHEAINWFLRNVYPTVVATIPDVKLHIAGVHPQHRSLWESTHVICHNVISSSDLLRLYDNSTALIFPLQHGRYSAHVKIINAFARGCPVVMTPKANCVPCAQDGVSAFIASNANEFAAKIITLLSSPEIAKKISLNALNNLKAIYKDKNTIIESVDAVYQSALSSCNPKV